MKLIADIINELMDLETPLSSPFLKTKVLASRIKNEELLSWVNSELNGYDDGQSIPDYRKCEGLIEGTYINGQMQFTNHVLPLTGLSSEQKQILRNMDFRQGITALESLTTGGASAKVGVALPAETVYELGRNVRNAGNRFFNLLSARKIATCNEIIEALSAVRTKLLDFMLKIEDEFGIIADIDDLKQRSERITTIMNQTIVNHGDGNILNTGNNSIINANVKIHKGDKETLKQSLKAHHIQEQDIEELLTVVDLETPSNATTLGSGVKEWMQKMLGKAIDGSWQVSIGAAGGILSDILLAYYGLK